MASYNSNEFKNGLKVLIDQEPCIILDCEYIKPGKGQAFTRIKVRNLKTGRVVERTYKSGETLQSADIIEKEMQYLYGDGTHWHFMDTSTYDQYAVSTEAVADCKQWLKEQDNCIVMLWDGVPLLVTPPNFVHLKVSETDPGLKGDTSGGGSKPAKLETGATIRTPLFIQTGDIIKIDTRTGEYVSRAKN